MLHALINDTPWLTKGLIVSALVACLLAFPAARVLRVPPVVGWLYVMAFGGILVTTWTPSLSDFTVRICATSPLSPIRPHDLITMSTRSLNVFMFVPLALLSVLPRRRTALLATTSLAVALPFIVELGQYLFPHLGRTCSYQDVIDNLTGVVLGVIIGLLIRLTWSTLMQTRNTDTSARATKASGQEPLTDAQTRETPHHG